MNRNVWLVGHALSMGGLIDAAFQVRDVANSQDERGRRLQLAEKILDRLYYEDRFIDWLAWIELHRLLHKAE